MSEELATILAATLRSMASQKGAALKELAFGEGFVDHLGGGAKHITIRRGWRDFDPDETTVAVCAEGDRFLLRIVSCDYHKLISVPRQDLSDAGFASPREALDRLRCFYPDLTYLSIVSVIRLEVIARVVEE